MKNKFAIIALSMSLLASSAAFAEGEQKGENFAKHKAEVIADLNKEKGIIDQSITCVHSAQKRDDMEKCRNQTQTAMEKLRQEKINQRKNHLQDQIKKLDDKSQKISNKDTAKGGDSTTKAE